MTEKKGTKTRKTATKRPRTSPSKQKKEAGFSLRAELKGLLIMLFAIVALLGMVGFSMGSIGDFMAGVFTYGFGILGIIPVLAILYCGWMYLYKGEGPRIFTLRNLWILLFYVFLLTLIPLIRVDAGKELMTTSLAHQGGVVGGVLTMLWRSIFGYIGAILVNLVLLVCTGLVITRLSLRKGIHIAKDTAVVGLEKAGETVDAVKERIVEWKELRKEERKLYDQEKDLRFRDEESSLSEVEEPLPPMEEAPLPVEEFLEDAPVVNDSWDEEESLEAVIPEEVTEEPPLVDDLEEEPVPKEMPLEVPSFLQEPAEEIEESQYEEVLETAPEPLMKDGEEGTDPPLEELEDIPTIAGTDEDRAAVAVSTDGAPISPLLGRPYVYPSLEMLSKGKSNPITSGEVANNTKILESTLQNFGITAKVVNATQGPTVTRYELEPAPGTKVGKITSLQDDIKMSLAAIDIRMEAPIPGKSAIGIEVPNKNVAAVHLRDVLENETFQMAKGGIPVGLGKDIADQPVITDLAKMPHLLVAGSTGSGKSVCINTLISSVLFSRKPEEVKLILIDPKMVELSVYNGVPHLMVPVVTDMNKAASVLRWAVREMESRYKTLATVGVRNLEGFNKLHPDKAMPLVLIIIDELADLMLTNPDVEESISRLAAKARAAGIHMVLATQRPSVNVITGTIKANVPSRIAFAVATQIDSRTILDQGGAEQLLGKGDMLFNPIGANKPLRIQGAFISDEEVERVVEFVKSQGMPIYDEEIMKDSESAVDDGGHVVHDDEDELLQRAVEMVFNYNQASTSLVQRRLRVGYSRAGRLIDMMEERGIIGPSTTSSRGRDILMTAQEVRDKYFPNLDVND